MMSSNRKEHLELTSDQYRDPGAVPAQVVAIENLSGTVKGLKLQVEQKIIDGGLQFKPGQWLDFFISGLDQVGGFSMSSSPSVLKSQGILELAVKISSWGPADWVHTKCTVGDWVTVRFGGDFYYPQEDLTEPHSLVLIGGGVGINPLYSILRHSAELMSSATTPAPSQVSLLYSASTADELIFRSDIEAQCRHRDTFRAEFFVTRERGESEDGKVNYRRITKADLERTLSERGERPERTVYYLCGPPDMVDQVRTWLAQLNITEENIRYELWW